MVEWLRQLAYALSLRFKSRARLEAENLVLRQQLNVLTRKLPKRLQLTNSDRSSAKLFGREAMKRMHEVLCIRERFGPKRREMLCYSSGRRCEVASSSTQSSSV